MAVRMRTASYHKALTICPVVQGALLQPLFARRYAAMRKYAVSRRTGTVDAIANALESCGCRIEHKPSPTEAPFEFEATAPSGEPLQLVCYAFTANKYAQSNRPQDEHRFQIKYGSDFESYHDLFIDPTGRKTTLFFGYHEEEQLFIAADPEMHNPTRFSSSVEFKTEHLEECRQRGWFGWERERKAGRRVLTMPQENCSTEVLLGFTPENFLRYVTLERVAQGLDAGERLLMIDRIGRGIAARDNRHPLELAFGLSATEILDVLNSRFRLLVAVRGGVAEQHLQNHLETLPNIERIRRFDEDGQPDFEVTYQRRKFRIECKNVLRKLRADGIPAVDFQKTRAAKGNPCSRYYGPEQFEILAACLHPVSEQWEFRFQSTTSLPSHKKCAGKISERILVTPAWNADLRLVLDSLHQR